MKPEVYSTIRELCRRSLDLGAYPISESCGRLIKLIVKLLLEARGEIKAVEVGTGIGCSTMWIVTGILELGGRGEVYTIEKNTLRYAEAEKTLMKVTDESMASLVRRIVKIIHGDALNIIPQLKFHVDFAFLDGKKEEYIDYLKLLKPKMPEGSILAAHNVISHGGILKEFIDAITGEEWETVIVPIDPGGLSISVRKPYSSISP